MLRIAVLGIEILRLDWDGEQHVEDVEYVEAEDGVEVDAWDGKGQCGAHVERDGNPLAPEDRFGWEWSEDSARRRFGFC